MKRIIFVTTILILFVGSANAELWVDDARGLVYDTDLDITWLQDVNYAGGRMTWDNSMTWASTLIYEGYDDWRLPTTLVPDTSCSFDSRFANGCNCTGSELVYLYYIGLGNDVTGSPTFSPFDYIEPDFGASVFFWSSTSHSSGAWRVNYSVGGSQGLQSKNTISFAWAVRDGNSGVADPNAPPVIPEPISSVLFVSGAGVLVGRRYLKK